MNTFGRILEISTSPSLVMPPLEYGFILGSHWDENPAAFTPATDGHLVLTGGFSKGKTVLLSALIEEVAQNMDVHVAHSWHQLNPDPNTIPDGLASFTDSAAGCAAMLRGVRDEVRRRVQLCEAAGGTFESLPDTRRILVILDDTRHMLSEDEYSHTGEGAAKAQSIADIAEIAQSSRLAGVTFVFSSHWTPAESMIPAEVLTSEVTLLELCFGISPWILQDLGLEGEMGLSNRQGMYTCPGAEETRIIVSTRRPAGARQLR